MTSTYSTSRFKKGLSRARSRGFSLVELLVSLAIMVAILTLVLTNQSKYTEGSALTGLADNISLGLTQAQTYGVSVKEFSPGSEEFSAAYGMSFNVTAQGSNDSYIYFADRGSKNGMYDSGWGCPTTVDSECIEKTSISRGNIISNICYIHRSGPEQCNLGGVDITYVRPDTRAMITYFNQNGTVLSVPNAIAAKIEVSSPSGAKRYISVYDSGQISVQ